jgi:hypothetical protein
MNACRFCTKAPIRSQYGEPIKYGVRHYAHAECGLKELGAAFFDRLALWQLQNFPYFAAKQFGLTAELTRRLNEAEERSL